VSGPAKPNTAKINRTAIRPSTARIGERTMGGAGYSSMRLLRSFCFSKSLARALSRKGKTAPNSNNAAHARALGQIGILVHQLIAVVGTRTESERARPQPEPIGPPPRPGRHSSVSPRRGSIQPYLLKLSNLRYIPDGSHHPSQARALAISDLPKYWPRKICGLEQVAGLRQTAARLRE
jgi:hypothetical protein